VGTAAAASGDIGTQDATYPAAAGAPTGSKPESKLWFNAGQWWASMYDPALGGFAIFRLDRPRERWVSTGTALDLRAGSRADVLWDGAKLYVASHLFATSGTVAAPADAARLYRYSYDPASGAYGLDPGYPVTINGATSETLVIDRDSTGTLWATWTQGHRVYVAHTLGDDAAWGAPSVLPGVGTTVSADDISSLVRFGGSIGVMWSNQADGHEYFAVHGDGAGDGAWSTEVVPTGASPDDHVNLKADASGRVYAALKTSEDLPGQPLTLLMVRAAGGAWSAHTFGRVSDSHTRPIVELDEQHGVVHMLATCPQPPVTSGQSGGDICEKTTSMANPSFGPGPGTPIIRAAGSADMNDASSTKQGVDGSTGLVVLAHDTDTASYWHADLSLGSPPPSPAGTTASGASPGTAPGAVPASAALGVSLPALTLRAQRLPRQRFRLRGTVHPVHAVVVVSLLRRGRHGRWIVVGRARVRPARTGAARFSFVVRRHRVRRAYRVAITVPGAGTRSSRAVAVPRRR
jgi:hypothetical protein